MNRIYIIPVLLLIASCSQGKLKKTSSADQVPEVLNTNSGGSGPSITLELYRGKSFYYPLMAAWLEDEGGRYIQTLYVARSVATGVFSYGKQEGNKWVSAEKRAPQTLPYWAHKRGIKAADGLYMPDEKSPVPDAYTGATPLTSFILNSKSDTDLPPVFRVKFEINQNWDWNEYWTNDKYPGDENYMMSCQPALVYEALFDKGKSPQRIRMEPVGHSHYSGKTGELFTDLSTLTTALQIADSIIVSIR
ncbi:MAG: DUF2271 domain-containing protein [Bacteroidales bacterium]|jgi:hypothetical protein|nr:DUF2271 domain-containing protein [Bacteroidales bacterium]MCU0407494.1 DUF2271 domain-containing protein [Bacteroidales bacterium]